MQDTMYTKEIDTLSIQRIAHCLNIDMNKAKDYRYMILIISSSRALAGQLKIMQELHSVCIFFLPPFVMIMFMYFSTSQ